MTHTPELLPCSERDRLLSEMADIHDAALRAEGKGMLFAAAAYDRKWHEKLKELANVR